ncbi:hypothetical protein Fmac_011762 [Flemingia macrophylla]|uniref:Heparanase-like protein 2 n=1 Tax=Flemingia macrophylla TaxID=520843 RepID=A0ABD1MND2_9FABA
MSDAKDVKLVVNGVTSIATTDNNFICATLDWWPANKCNYGDCPWGQTGILNLALGASMVRNGFKASYLNVAPGVVDGVTHHIYNLGAGVDKDLINKIQDPYFLSHVAETFKSVAQAVKEFTPWAAPWVGEAGGAYNSGSKDPGVTVLLINMSNSTTFNISFVYDMNLNPIFETVPGRVQKTMREEYHMTPKDGNIQSDVVLLNGTPLQLTKSLDIPEMKPQLIDASSPIIAKPDSIIFIHTKSFKAPTCG